MLEEFALPRDDLMRDVGNRLLALVDRLDEKFAAADLVSNVIFDLVPVTFFRHDVLVGITNAEVGNLFPVQDDLVFPIDLFNRDVGDNVIFGRLGENRPRSRLELCDIVRAFLDLLDRDSHSARDFGETAFAQILHVFGNDLVFETVSFAGALQLNEQALLQIPRADARRIKALDKGEHVLKIFLWNAGVEGHFFRRGLQEPIVIDVPDDEFGCFTIIRVQDLLIQLRHQVLLQSLLGDDRVEKELSFFLILL